MAGDSRYHWISAQTIVDRKITHLANLRIRHLADALGPGLCYTETWIGVGPGLRPATRILGPSMRIVRSALFEGGGNMKHRVLTAATLANLRLMQAGMECRQ